jgi:hypothetical protein
MAALTTSDRFFAVGTTKVKYIATIAATPKVPTRTEIDGGTELSAEIADIQGWTKEAGSIATPDLGTRFTGNLPGRITVSQASLTFYADLEGTDVRGTLTQDLTGYIVFMDGGDVTASLMDIYPIRVASVGKVRSTGDQAAQITVMFTITSEPLVDQAIPATV